MTLDKSTQKFPPHLFKLSERWELMRVFYEAGVDAALYDALFLAVEAGNAPPEWAVEGALEAVGDRLKFNPDKEEAKTDYYKAIIRFRRWQAVMKSKEEGFKGDDVFNNAIELLEGTFASGGFHTMKKSYQNVRNDLKDPENAKQYYQAMRDAQIISRTPTLSFG